MIITLPRFGISIKDWKLKRGRKGSNQLLFKNELVNVMANGPIRNHLKIVEWNWLQSHIILGFIVFELHTYASLAAEMTRSRHFGGSWVLVMRCGHTWAREIFGWIEFLPIPHFSHFLCPCLSILLTWLWALATTTAYSLPSSEISWFVPIKIRCNFRLDDDSLPSWSSQFGSDFFRLFCARNRPLCMGERGSALRSRNN